MTKETCFRAQFAKDKAVRVVAKDDPAVWAIAHMVVAGIDNRYDIHPSYASRVRQDGVTMTQQLIKRAVTVPGACDKVQTKRGLGGIGLYGGLSENGREFIFYEWTTSRPRFRLHMTHQQARDIVSGKQKYVKFLRFTRAHFSARQRAKKKMCSR